MFSPATETIDNKHELGKSNLEAFEINILRKLLDVFCDTGCCSAGKKDDLQLAA